MAKQSCLSSSEQVLVGIRYSIGEVGQLVAGVVPGRVAVHGRVGGGVHERHLGGLRKMVWVHRKVWEVVGSDHTGQVGCLMGEVRGWGRVDGRLVREKVRVNNPSLS